MKGNATHHCSTWNYRFNRCTCSKSSGVRCSCTTRLSTSTCQNGSSTCRVHVPYAARYTRRTHRRCSHAFGLGQTSMDGVYVSWPHSRTPTLSAKSMGTYESKKGGDCPHDHPNHCGWVFPMDKSLERIMVGRTCTSPCYNDGISMNHSGGLRFFHDAMGRLDR